MSVNAGEAVAGLLREVRAAEERAVIIMCQKHGQRPTARPLCQHLLRDLIDAIYIRALFAIDLDVDKAFVQKLSGGFIFETFFLETVAQ